MAQQIDCNQYGWWDPRRYICYGVDFEQTAPQTINNAEQQVAQTATNTLAQSIGNIVGDTATASYQALGSIFVKATGAKSLVDLEQRGVLITGGIFFIFLGIIVLFFANGGAQTLVEVTGQGEEEEEGEGESAGEGEEESGTNKPKKAAKKASKVAEAAKVAEVAA